MNIKQIKNLLAMITPQVELTGYGDLLLSSTEYLLNQYYLQKKEIQELKDRIKELKREKGKPKIRANVKENNNVSSEKVRHKKKKWKKSSKKDKINIHKTRVKRVDKNILPTDAVFKGYNDVIIQNLKIIPENTLFKLECWYSSSRHKTYRAPLDVKYKGSEFHPELRALIIDLYIQGRMTQYSISNFLKDKGIIISEGTISNILSEHVEVFNTEAEHVYQAGLESSDYQQTDETGARHMGKTGWTMIVCSALHTSFITSFSKNYFQVLKNLNGGSLSYTFNEKTIELLEKEKIADWDLNFVLSLDGRTFNKAGDILHLYKKKYPLPPSELTRKKILKISSLVHYREQNLYKPVEILVSDAAGQFKGISNRLQLCWIHCARNFKVLEPYSLSYRKILDDFLDDLWKYYFRLEDYRQNPTEKEKTSLWIDYDKLFDRTTGYEVLDKLLSTKLSKKSDYLTVLDYPHIPIHNNHSEEQLRYIVIKRKISSGTRSNKGRKARDSFYSLMLTCKKLNISFFDYLKDRLYKSYSIAPLDEIIVDRSRFHSGFS
jgi:hypothetical protein